MDNANIQKLVEICKMYYEQQMTQEMISKELGISRSAVSMSLAEAKNIGIIQVEIKDPSVNNEELASRLEETFGLRKCIVVSSGTHNERSLLRVMISQAVRFAVDMFQSHSSIGIAWGNTCYGFMQAFPDNTPLCDISVVPLVGASPLLTQEFQLNESIRMFANKLRGFPIFLYAPGFVNTLEDKKRITSSAYMQPVLDLWEHLDFAILGIGCIQERGEIRQFRCGGESMVDEIRRHPDIAVGDVCARQFNIRGEFIENDFNRKLIGINKEGLSKAKHVMAMAVGSSKIISIIGALRTGYIHYFVTDEKTATQVLQLLDSGKLPE